MKKELVIHNLFLVGVVVASMLNIITNCLVAVFVSAANSGLSMSATINPSSTITISANNVALDITPSVEGTFRSAYTTVSTYTNSTDTCTVTMTTGSTNLTSGANSIATLSSAVSEANFESDRWGFRIGSSGDYSPVALSNTIATYSQATGSTGATNNIYFASKLTPATKAGTYTDTVTFMSTCVPSSPTDISDLTYMQDFATLTSAEKATILSSMTTDQQYQLMDNRDNKSYYISKLADGNVWMTQNLDHDIVTTANFYTSANTDVSANWTASTATYSTGTTTWDITVTGNSILQSYDPGDYCWSGTLQDSATITCSQNGSHFHLGNYYSWTAAVAMNDSSSHTTTQDVDQSICPAGWTLPKDGSITTSGSFEYLVTQYGWDDNTDEMTGSNSIWGLPLYFPLSGDWSGSSTNIGDYGFYWTSVVYDSIEAYRPYYHYDGSLYPDNYYHRYYGRTVRCLVR